MEVQIYVGFLRIVARLIIQYSRRDYDYVGWLCIYMEQ